jgi:hypothetical protein
MSRFSITANDGRQYVYGYDRPLMYYFLDLVRPKQMPKALVGMLSPVYGSARNLLEMCERRGIKLPRIHREELCLDLPLSEEGYEDAERESDEFESALDQYGAG